MNGAYDLQKDGSFFLGLSAATVLNAKKKLRGVFHRSHLLTLLSTVVIDNSALHLVMLCVSGRRIEWLVNH